MMPKEKKRFKLVDNNMRWIYFIFHPFWRDKRVNLASHFFYAYLRVH